MQANSIVPSIDESIIMAGPFCSGRKVDAFTGATISVRPNRRVFFGETLAPESLELVPDESTPLRDAAAEALAEINNRNVPASPRPATQSRGGILSRLTRR